MEALKKFHDEFFAKVLEFNVPILTGTHWTGNGAGFSFNSRHIQSISYNVIHNGERMWDHVLLGYDGENYSVLEVTRNTLNDGHEILYSSPDFMNIELPESQERGENA